LSDINGSGVITGYD